MTAKQRQQIQHLVENDLLRDAIAALQPLCVFEQHQKELATISGALSGLEASNLLISSKENQDGRKKIGDSMLNLSDRVKKASQIPSPPPSPTAPSDSNSDLIVSFTYVGMAVGVFFPIYYSSEEQFVWKSVQALFAIILGIIILYHHGQKVKSRSIEKLVQHIREGQLSREDIEKIKKGFNI